MDYLPSLYGCMFLVGVLGNGSLGLTLCCGPGAKSRSPLLFGLIVADLLVCCLSGPITAALYVLSSWTQTWRHVALFIQVPRFIKNLDARVNSDLNFFRLGLFLPVLY